MAEVQVAILKLGKLLAATVLGHVGSERVNWNRTKTSTAANDTFNRRCGASQMIKRGRELTSNSTENPGLPGAGGRSAYRRKEWGKEWGGGEKAEIEKRFIRKKDDSRDASPSWLIPKRKEGVKEG
ncbi:hypothetical protein WN51_12275 [Melipona quadrifasciata]|uniref:Uncharacterized protein n=1 Tax=Melipona quadrifasciata TaxID=166423 RepID=A0A0N0BH04_9HYME|nr:hypothetical protein WN51_12275 [Melipona quadrifasciata]